MLADVVDEARGEEVLVRPRTILRRQIARAAALGMRPKMASELELYLFRGGYERAHAKGYVGLQRSGWYNEDYQLFQSTKAEPFYRRLRSQMTEAGVPIEFSKGEAAPGQHEVNIRYADALEAADRHVLLKHGAKEIAHGQGCAVTFMAKPAADWTGSSGHVHLGELDARRHRWARDNRTCGLRVVGGGSALRIEDRFPGADVNPYLAYAAILAAGPHGIEHRIEPPAEHRGNGCTATGVTRVPASLAEAIGAGG